MKEFFFSLHMPTHIYTHTHPLHNNEKQRYYQELTRKRRLSDLSTRTRERTEKKEKKYTACIKLILKRRKERKKREHMTMGAKYIHCSMEERKLRERASHHYHSDHKSSSFFFFIINYQ